jgi:asparagine synthase (glutamine-hydrolysing)
MQKVSATPVRTFSIGFTSPEYNEAPYAKKVAAYLGTKHTEFYVTPENALAIVPELPRIWDEPFADSSQIPTYLVSRLAREHVTVVLSGDGGDELFCGYPRYFLTRRLWNLRKKIPLPLRVCSLFILDLIPEEILESSLRRTKGLFRWLGIQEFPGKLSPRLKELITASRFEEFYGWTNSHILPEKGFIPGKDQIAPEFFHKYFPCEDLWTIMTLLDLNTYLPEDLLTKIDRASMAVGLEARVPLLDHKVVTLSARFPSALKVRDGKGKWILRQILYRHVPKALVDREKMGFGIPIREWIRGPLRDWAEDLINDAHIRGKDYLNVGMVHRLWQEHKHGKYNHQYLLWNILTFLAWLEYWQ